MEVYKDVFISYGRGNENSAGSKAFATKLVEKLTGSEHKVWFDNNDIPLATKFQDKIDEGIAHSDSFVFIASPHSIASEYCRKEVALARKLNKKIIPVGCNRRMM